MRDFTKTPVDLSLCRVVTYESPDDVGIAHPGDVDYIDPAQIPLEECQDLFVELTTGSGHGDPDIFRSEKYTYDLTLRDWKVIFKRLGIKDDVLTKITERQKEMWS